eukprot:COSAG01_NODE_13609_length_1559_cov_1.595205_1_plen_168_part_00
MKRGGAPSQWSYGLEQPVAWQTRAVSTEGDVRPLVGVHMITRESASAYVAAFKKRKVTAAEVLEQNLALKPGGRRLRAPWSPRLIKVGARGASRATHRDSHEEETCEEAVEAARRLAEAARESADGQAHRLPASLVNPTTGMPHSTPAEKVKAAWQLVTKDQGERRP